MEFKRIRQRYFSPAAFPNFITLCNLFSGFLSILMVIHQNYELAAGLIILGLICDSLDGHIARIFHNPTEFGKELDSLADAVTFVVAPCVLAVTLLFFEMPLIMFVVSFFYIAAGGYRLARYNLETSAGSKTAFYGLPTPAAAMTLAMSVIMFHEFGWTEYPRCAELTALLMAGLSYLMVSRIRYPKFSAVRFVAWRALFYVMLALLVIFTLAFNFATASAVIVLAYVILSPVFCVFNKDLFREEKVSTPEGH